MKRLISTMLLTTLFFNSVQGVVYRCTNCGSGNTAMTGTTSSLRYGGLQPCQHGYINAYDTIYYPVTTYHYRCYDCGNTWTYDDVDINHPIISH